MSGKRTQFFRIFPDCNPGQSRAVLYRVVMMSMPTIEVSKTLSTTVVTGFTANCEEPGSSPSDSDLRAMRSSLDGNRPIEGRGMTKELG
jgi:hypothetical protein